MKKYLFLVILSIVPIAQAYSEDKIDKQSVYNSPADIPRVLRDRLNSHDLLKEQYIASVLNIISQISNGKTVLSSEDIVLSNKKASDAIRHSKVARLIRYDQNFDGMVSREEITNMLSESDSGKSKGLIGREVDLLMSGDENKDNTLTVNEMSLSKNSRYDGGYPRNEVAEELLGLDPNGDQKITIDEAKALAEKAFDTIDTDHNGILSKQELDPAVQLNQGIRIPRNSECNFPKPQPNEKIIFLGGYEGSAISTVSIAGQVEETDVVPIDIKGNTGEKLYIIAYSFMPIIWQINGQTDKIAHLVLAGPSIPKGTSNNDMGGDRINAGVVNIDRSKVSFIHARGCGFRDAFDPKTQDSVRVGIKDKLGQSLDMYGVLYKLNSVAIHDQRIDFEKPLDWKIVRDSNPPNGFDAAIWKEHMGYMPRGVINLTKEQVVSDAEVEPYLVLPKLAGLAKLVHDGAIVREKALYKIVKNIPYYPAGLYGAYSRSFIIAKDVLPPRGDPGHSCVFSEETGESMTSMPVCSSNYRF